MALWWDRYPERLEAELQALGAAGIRCEPVVESIRRGIYQLKVWPMIDGQPVELIVTFPDHYPFFRFEIAAPSLALDHHQQPFAKILCFIGRETFWWNTTDTVAGFLSERLCHVIRAGMTNDLSIAAPLEQARGEPFSDYYPYAFAICHVDSSWTIPASSRSGAITLGFLDYFIMGPEEPPCLQAVVLRVNDEQGREVAAAPAVLRGKFPRE